MKKTIVFALTLLLLIGCRHHRAVSPWLVELDSLIAVTPDSAAALLEAIPSDSLLDPESRAYHALLLTQAKYKAYIPAYSLDTINLAVRHYSDGHDPEKQTRSILYKGCVFEELPQIDSAMYYYKAAEDLATQSGDTYHRGYALMRMASLFQSKYAKKEAIEYYRSSLSCAQTIHDDYDALYELQELANLYQTINLDSAFYYVDQAMTLSLQMDSAGYDYCLSTLASCCLIKKDYRQCVDNAREAINIASDSVAFFKSCHWAAQAYAMMGKKDSSNYYFNLAKKPKNNADRVLDLLTKSVVFGDSSSLIASGDLADTLINSEVIVSLTQAVSHYNYTRGIAVAKHNHLQTVWFLLFVGVIISLISLFAYWGKRRKEKRMAVSKQNEINKLYLELKEISQRSESLSQQNKELSQENEELQALAKKVQQTESDLSTDKDYANLENERLKEKQLSKSLEYIAGLLHTFIQQSHELKPSEFTEKFRKGFLETPNGGEVDFWYTLRVQADQVHGGAVEKLLAEHPDLNETFIRVLCMSALGFSTEMMATCLQHKSDYINTLKNRLKKKLDINCSIPDYLKQLGETR